MSARATEKVKDLIGRTPHLANYVQNIEAQRDELLAKCNAESARANRLLIECNNRIEQVRELLSALKRIAFEPQGEATASHAEVLQAVEGIARAAIANAQK